MLQSLNIPAIGEGLQEARVVAFLKQPGDTIKRDEVIYQMETDKAVMDVESPFEGVLTEWLAKVDDVLPIGAEVGRLEVGGVAVAAPAVVAAPVSAPAASNFVDLTIPAIGEGLQEARLVAVLKQPGDAIKRDDIIYQMETDKAVMDVECPYEGVLVEWLAPVDTVLAIGAPVGRMTVSGVVPAGVPVSVAPLAPAVASTPSVGSDSSGRRLDIPPRTRAYAKDKGVSAADLEKISAAGSKLMPEDVDRFLAGSAPAVAPAPAETPVVSDKFVETAVAGKQRILNSRMVRGNQLVVPGTIMVAVRWDAIETRRAAYKTAGGDFQPSSFTMFSFAVAQALKSFPGFRTTILGDDKYRTYNHANLGIAVSLPGDELVLAVVDDSDTFGWVEFAGRMREQIDVARGGKDQANESVTISLTNMQSFGLRDAVPVVVPPSVATLFLGEVYKGLDQNSDEMKMVKYANLALTFDHRVINGVGAAAFIKAVKDLVENIDTTLAL